jgi:hypothetical protein
MRNALGRNAPPEDSVNKLLSVNSGKSLSAYEANGFGANYFNAYVPGVLEFWGLTATVQDVGGINADSLTAMLRNGQPAIVAYSGQQGRAAEHAVCLTYNAGSGQLTVYTGRQDSFHPGYGEVQTTTIGRFLSDNSIVGLITTRPGGR